MARIILIKYDPEGREFYRYILSNFKSISTTMNTPVTPAPIPEETSEENILVKIEGNSTTLKLSWKIKEESSDQATVFTWNEAGTSSTTADHPSKTLPEQILFFKDNFPPVSIADSFTIIIDFEPPVNKLTESLNIIQYDGTFSQFRFNTTDSEVVTFNASADFIEGTVFGIYEIDTSSAPENLQLTSPSAGVLWAAWDKPLNEGSESIPTSNGYRVQYRLISGDSQDTEWTDVDKNKTGDSESVSIASGLTVDKVYSVRVKAKTSLGFGVISKTKNITIT